MHSKRENVWVGGQGTMRVGVRVVLRHLKNYNVVNVVLGSVVDLM